jgi:hypothetical protein
MAGPGREGGELDGETMSLPRPSLVALSRSDTPRARGRRSNRALELKTGPNSSPEGGGRQASIRAQPRW